jgi:small subunit ribosomal protein S9
MARDITQYYGTGRRKSSTARVFLRPGTGRIFVNSRELDAYIQRETLRMDVRRPLVLTETANGFDTFVNVAGGGETGQVGAMRLGIARALIEFKPELRAALKADGLLTRDSREVERKKPGQPGARRRFQFSKR